ncbi:uncharacterized protein LOC126838852 [Adelges cooleyi]|uniref:uncharacterized protein LOC126838852 n=1 Tax=Adelges cooleyi TaxID=133065 RepID=UPI0021802D4B|nr:uncharacterized protein LOC126838852 [Adelges cooleyi]
MMKTSIFFITFYILVSLYVRDANSKQYLVINKETQMPLEGDIVEYLSVEDNDYLKNVKQLIEDKLLEESILAYAKEIHLKVSNDELLRNITAMEKQDLMRY